MNIGQKYGTANSLRLVDCPAEVIMSGKDVVLTGYSIKGFNTGIRVDIDEKRSLKFLAKELKSLSNPVCSVLNGLDIAGKLGLGDTVQLCCLNIDSVDDGNIKVSLILGKWYTFFLDVSYEILENADEWYRRLAVWCQDVVDNTITEDEGGLSIFKINALERAFNGISRIISDTLQIFDDIPLCGVTVATKVSKNNKMLGAKKYVGISHGEGNNEYRAYYLVH